MRREAGFTVLEVAVAGFFLAVVIGSAAIAVATDTRATQVIVAPMSPEMRVNTALERISSELRMAGEFGEDLDHDGEMDPGEDANANGTLDADWNLADGVAGQDTLSFNRRIDLFDADGNIEVTGIYSRRVTYRLDDDRLIREWDYTAPDGSVETREAVLARGIVGLRFTRTGQMVTVAVDVEIPGNAHAVDRRTATTRIWLRN